jgi:hypothetical protein
MDVDRIFAYHTPKMVTIQDRSLGVVKQTLMLLIFLYVFIYSMWYKGMHFQLSEVEGLARQQWQEPTMDWCNPAKVDCDANFSRITNLPYCDKYYGYGPKEAVSQHCEYYDARELPITLPNGILIPTYIQTYRQHKECVRGSETCKRKYTYVDEEGYRQHGDGESQPLQTAFVADVEDFTLTIDHSFRTTDGKVSYDDFLMQGRWMMCDKEEKNKADSDWVLDAAKPRKKHECHTRPMKCVHMHCDEMAYNEEESWGDVVTEFVTGEPKGVGGQKPRLPCYRTFPTRVAGPTASAPRGPAAAPGAGLGQPPRRESTPSPLRRMASSGPRARPAWRRRRPRRTRASQRWSR